MAQVSHTTEPPARPARLSYGQVFLLLAVVTAVEVWLGTLGLQRSFRTGLFLVLSLFKAGMIAAYYMHLRSDSRLYAALLISPAVLLLVFAILAAVP